MDAPGIDASHDRMGGGANKSRREDRKRTLPKIALFQTISTTASHVGLYQNGLGCAHAGLSQNGTAVLLWLDVYQNGTTVWG
jgi:hypothetical protein